MVSRAKTSRFIDPPRSKAPRSYAENFNQLRADYQAAKESRFQRRRRVIHQGSGADWHYRTQHDYLKIMEYARDMVRNDVILSSIIDRASTNAIQGGMFLDVMTGSKSLDQDILGGWNEYAYNADNIDVAGEDDFADMQHKNLTAVFTDGDIWPIANDDGTVMPYEAHRIRTPHRTKRAIFQGVELAPGRRPVAVWVTNEDLEFDATGTLIKDYTSFDIRDGNGIKRVFHIHTSKTKRRYGQTRGISALAPCFDLIGMHDDIEFAAVLKQQLVNALVFFKERDKDFQGGAEEPLGASHQRNREDGSVETIEQLGPGTMIKGKPGETIKGFAPNIPGSEFFPHVKLLLTLIGVNFGMPLMLVLMDGSETNFSGWRGAFDQAKMGFRDNQRSMVRRFCSPLFEFHLSHREKFESRFRAALAKVRANALRKRQPWFKWHMPSFPYIQPMDDRSADLIAVANYQEAPSTNMAKNGFDFETETRRGIKDRGMAIEWAMAEAERLNAIKPENQPEISWRELFTPLQPKNVNLTVTEMRGDTQSPSQPAKPAPAVK